MMKNKNSSLTMTTFGRLLLLASCLTNGVSGECEGTRLPGSCDGQFNQTMCTFVPLQDPDECRDIIRPQCEEVCGNYLDCTCTQTKTGSDTIFVGGIAVTTVDYSVQCEDIFVGLSCITLDEDECDLVNGCSWSSASCTSLPTVFSFLVASVTAIYFFH